MKLLLSIIALGATVVALFSSAFTVDETEQVFITQFGRIVGTPINSNTVGAPTHAELDKSQAGLHWKIPFIQKVNRIEKRVLEWDGPATEMPTRDKLYITVDNFARWRISDPKTYFEKLRDERSALSRLDNIIGSETRSVIAAHDLIEVIRSIKDRKPDRDEALATANPNVGRLPEIVYGRNVLSELILKAAQPKVKHLGIELIDVRFKRINYKSGVIEKIFARMASERQQIAERFRSEGAGEAAKILGRKERDLQLIESGAYRKEQEIRGKADAQATGIYAAAYNSSASAADFYQFMKTLETYQKTLGKDSTVILTSDSDLFRFFKHINPPPAKAAGQP